MMNKHLNIVMVSEACAQMGAVSLPDNEDTYSYGAGAIVFETMNSIVERLRREDDVIFDEVKLLFFKNRWEWIEAQSSQDDYCELFFHYMVNDFAHGDPEYIESPSARLCTAEALNEALTKIEQDGGSFSVLVFTAYRENIFAVERAADILLTPEHTPDLSLFFLNGVSADEAALLSRFNTDRDNAHIISFDSVEADADYFYRALAEQQMSIKNAVDLSIRTRRGLAYSLYGMLKSALKISHSVAAELDYSE